MSAPWRAPKASAGKAIDMTVAPASIIAETEHREYRVIQTNDPKFVGQADCAGFKISEGFVVRDAFDEPVLPNVIPWFYSPWDAIAAIEMLDTVVPAIKEGEPATTLVYEYTLMWQYRQHFHQVYAALHSLQTLCDDAATFGDDTLQVKDVRAVLHNLRQRVAGPSGVRE
jgi:hypothetical protein